jgi:hypothetical protein
MKKNIYLMGTSNSIKGNSYYTQLLKSERLELVGASRVGDVPSPFFISDIEKIINISNVARVDVVILDSMINDTLMAESKVLSVKTLDAGLKSLAHLLKKNFGETLQIILLNFCPDAVKGAKYFDDVKQKRVASFRNEGFFVCEIDIANEQDTIIYPLSDPLHHDSIFANKICEKIEEKAFSLEESDTRSNNLLIQHENFGFVDFTQLKYSKIKQTTSIFSSALMSVTCLSLFQDEELIIEFASPTKILGLKFISSSFSDAYIRIQSDVYDFLIPSASKYPKPLIRFYPFSEEDLEFQIKKLIISIEHKHDIIAKLPIRKIPNYSAEESNELILNREVKLSGIIQTESLAKPALYISNKIDYRPLLKISFQCFWPGFNPVTDPIFGKLLSQFFSISCVTDASAADIVVVSWYSPDMNRTRKHQQLKSETKGKLVYYTAEHDGAGLQGVQQVDFELYDHIFSHYNIAHSRHTWLPNYIRRHGTGVFSIVNQLYLRNLNKPKPKHVQFCYSNDTCEYRNQLYQMLNKRKKVDANGKLFNTTDVLLPREHDKYIDALSEYKFVISCENSSFAGYNTEKIVHALMAGAVPLYWGDPTISSVWNPECFINLHSVNRKICVEAISSDGDAIFEEFKRKAAVPFDRAEQFEEELIGHYKAVFLSLLSN